MWILRWVFAVLIILMILGFALQNTSEQVSVVLLKGQYETGPLPLWLVVYISFGLGVIFWLFMSIFQVLGLKTEIRRMRVKSSKVQKELDNLRNLSLEDDLDIIPEPGKSIEKPVADKKSS